MSTFELMSSLRERDVSQHLTEHTPIERVARIVHVLPVSAAGEDGAAHGDRKEMEP